MAAQQQRLDAVANDLANANTTGYKHTRVGFRDLRLRRRPAARRAQGVQPGAGAAAVDAGRALRAGRAAAAPAARSTSRSRARASSRSSSPTAATALTRDGDLHIDARRPPDDRTGALVQPAITIPAGIRRGPGLDRHRRHRAPPPAAASAGSSSSPSARRRACCRPATTPSSPPRASGRRVAAPAATELTQGALEASNTDMARGDGRHDRGPAHLPAGLKAIQTADEMMGIANGVKR